MTSPSRSNNTLMNFAPISIPAVIIGWVLQEILHFVQNDIGITFRMT
jgi:hypothetical protein